MIWTDVEFREITAYHRALAIVSSTVSYSVTKYSDVRLLGVAGIDPWQEFAPVFGALNLGFNTTY